MGEKVPDSPKKKGIGEDGNSCQGETLTRKRGEFVRRDRELKKSVYAVRPSRKPSPYKGEASSEKKMREKIIKR